MPGSDRRTAGSAAMKKGSSPTTAYVLAATLAAFAADRAHGYEIYKWVDANGVVHYGESCPGENAASCETLHIPATNPPGYDPAEDQWSVVRQAERISAQLSALKEERAEEEARERALASEERIAELEERVAAAEDAAYAARPVYTPFAGFLNKRHRFFDRDFRHRFPDRRPPRDRWNGGADPAHGWSGPGEPSRPGAPGFGAPAPR